MATTLRAGPILDDKPLERREVARIRCHQYEALDDRDGGELSVHPCADSSADLESCTFAGMSVSRCTIVRQDRKDATDDIFEVALELRAFLGRRKPERPESKLVPDRCADRAGIAMSAQSPDDLRARTECDRLRNDVRVEQILQRSTFRPVLVSRSCSK